ncbi:hypothetical protein QBC43DRAFT_127748 [Cladorrhinum sp. PSN259]|nr:hypothetical protein QBC43DRAFT_127748 [Cladorrhinum sp. PSN259]
MAELDLYVGQFKDITGFQDDAIIRKALRDNNSNLEMVIDQYFNGPDNFMRRYELKWDNAAWSASREGEPPNVHVIHADDTLNNEVIYGTEPQMPYAGLAPSRPPSRSDNRSPLSQVVDLQTTGYTLTGAPTTQQEEDDALARAIEASMNESSDGPALPPPAFDPSPQQSGVAPVFGPANENEDTYTTGVWDMVTTQHYLRPVDPSSRKRIGKDEVFLRVQTPQSLHRLGALLMIYHKIPAARNALLNTTRQSLFGYGYDPYWWDGTAIVAANETVPNWEDEICRLMAFLDRSDRSYGTINVLAGETSTRRSTIVSYDDQEKEFFHQLADELENRGKPDVASVFISDVEVINYEDASLQSYDRFGILELSYPRDAEPRPKNLYNIWDLIFYSDLKQTAETPSDGRIAWISQPSDVITCRLQHGLGEELYDDIEIPEEFYLDRFLKFRSEQILKIQQDMITAYNGKTRLEKRKDAILKWTNPKGNVPVDREKLLGQAIETLEAKVRRIKNNVYWKQHMSAREHGGDVPEYLPTPHESLEPNHQWNEGEARLDADEQAAVNHLEAQINDLKLQLENLAKFKETASKSTNTFEALFTKLQSYLTDAETGDEKWKPNQKYMLWGVVNDPNTVFLRSLKVEGEEPPVLGWRKVSYKPLVWENARNVVDHQWVTFADVKKEALGKKSSPILVYATEKALSEEPVELDYPQSQFVKVDNKNFARELERSSATMKALQKISSTGSLASLATDKASAGGSVGGDFEMMDVDEAATKEMQQLPDSHAGV